MGRPVPALERRPALPARLAYVWEAFWRLNRDRPTYIGMGAAVEGPIPWTAIDAYAARFGHAADPDEYRDFLFLIEGLDAAYVAHAASKAAGRPVGNSAGNSARPPRAPRKPRTPANRRAGQ